MSFVITTSLYYVNNKLHLWSVYTTIIYDAIARYKRLVGEDVIFITGVDEHGLKIQRTANEMVLNQRLIVMKYQKSLIIIGKIGIYPLINSSGQAPKVMNWLLMNFMKE